MNAKQGGLSNRNDVKIAVNETKQIKSKQLKWDKEEDNKLISLVQNFKDTKVKWYEVSKHFNKTTLQCYSRYRQINPALNRGKWTKNEDDKLVKLVKQYGKRWAYISKHMKHRSGKQIRDRFINCLDESNLKKSFSKTEDENIMYYYNIYGAKWSLIAKHFVGRTGDAIKNRYYWSIKPLLEKRLQPKNEDRLNLENQANFQEVTGTDISPFLYFEKLPTFECSNTNLLSSTAFSNIPLSYQPISNDSIDVYKEFNDYFMKSLYEYNLMDSLKQNIISLQSQGFSSDSFRNSMMNNSMSNLLGDANDFKRELLSSRDASIGEDLLTDQCKINAEQMFLNTIWWLKMQSQQSGNEMFELMGVCSLLSLLERNICQLTENFNLSLVKYSKSFTDMQN